MTDTSTSADTTAKPLPDDAPVVVVDKPEILKNKSTPQQKIIRTLLTLIVLGFIGYFIYQQLGGVSGVGDSLASVTAESYLVLFAFAAVNEITKAAPSAILVAKLKLGHSFVANEASGVVSNTIPGPSGTTMRYVIFRSWGITAADFGRSTVVNAIVNDTIQLVLPVFSVMLVAAQGGSIPSSIWWISGIAAVLSIIALVLMYFIARSERFTLWLGGKLAVWYAWFRGLLKKEVKTDVLEAIQQFRNETLTILSEKWLPLFTVLMVKYFATFAMFLVSLRAVGLNSTILTVSAAFACYALTRVLTIVEVTPGGIGVTEAVYISLLDYATGGKYDAEVVAGVLLFRGFTYLLPILIGGVCYVFWALKKSWRVGYSKVSRKAVSVA